MLEGQSSGRAVDLGERLRSEPAGGHELGRHLLEGSGCASPAEQTSQQAASPCSLIQVPSQPGLFCLSQLS